MEVSELLSKLDADEVELHGDMEVSELLAKLEADRADLQAAASSAPKAQEAPTDEAEFLELLREFRDKKEEDYDTDVQWAWQFLGLALPFGMPGSSRDQIT